MTKMNERDAKLKLEYNRMQKLEQVIWYKSKSEVQWSIMGYKAEVGTMVHKVKEGYSKVPGCQLWKRKSKKETRLTGVRNDKGREKC